MKTVSLLLPRTIFLGDFNLHHPIWSRDKNLDKHGDATDELVQLFSENGYSILNTRGVETYHVYRTQNGQPELYTSTLDLGWASPHLLPFILEFQVAPHLSNESNHYPLVTHITYAANRTSEHTHFLFSDENFEPWSASFKFQMDKLPPLTEPIENEDTFNTAVNNLQRATLTASHSACLQRINPLKRAKWFDSKVHEALEHMRKARRNLTKNANNHNALRYHMARK